MRLMRLWLWLFMAAAAALPAPAFSAGVRVIYPAYESETDTRFRDLIDILHMALQRTVPEYGPFELLPSEQKMNEARYLSALKQGGTVNIAWSSTSIAKEKDMLPLRIPLRKGILGFRIAFIRKDAQAHIDKVNTIDDLRTLTIGQGIGWGDVDLYEANEIRVVQTKYDSLFRMTGVGRFDLFPRGIGEIFTEFAIHAHDTPDLAIEKNLLIYYPWPYYFFFNRKNTELAQRVELGVRKMMKDGSFDTIFKKYNGKAIEQSRLKSRRLIRLPNPLLPPETPLEDPALWYDPAHDVLIRR